MSRKSRRPTPTARPGPSKPAASTPGLLAARVLLGAALAISAYLAWLSLSHGTPVGCGPESDCDRVLGSRWARWFGIPVSLFAVSIDALTLWATWQVGRGSRPGQTAPGWRVVLVGAWLILGAAAWFVGVQAAGVGWCPYCLAAHAAGGLGAVLLLREARQVSALAAGAGLQTAGLALGALAVLIGGQVLHRPATGRELKGFAAATNLPAATSSAPATMAAAGAAPASNAAPAATPAVPSAKPAAAGPVFTPGGVPVERMQRPFLFYEGMAAVDMLDVPVVGSPTNPAVMISLFDYTCHHCREMHPLLEEAQRTFSNRLAIVSLPMPLDASCNRTMTRTPPSHTNACEYARLGLMVWRANPARHAQFDHFLMTGANPPGIAAAVARAVALVGTNDMARAAKDPWVEERLQFSLALYEAAYRKGQGRMPQMIVGRNVAVGTYPRDELFKLLVDNLGLQRTP